MRKPDPENLEPAPRPRPDAIECRECWNDRTGMPMYARCHCGSFELFARWGERWAAVATMALHEKRGGEAYIFVADIRDADVGDRRRSEILEDLPEDLLQILALGTEPDR